MLIYDQRENISRMTCNWAVISKTCKSYLCDLHHMMLYWERYSNFAVVFLPQGKFLKHVFVSVSFTTSLEPIPSPHSGPLMPVTLHRIPGISIYQELRGWLILRKMFIWGKFRLPYVRICSRVESTGSHFVQFNQHITTIQCIRVLL